ncbi:MAG: hypothetical protein HOM55_06410 [Proteobacteria bacterium]|jgi:hypothetical protein|nr:hypothetical protein [Pseudomonadota bacterium]
MYKSLIIIVMMCCLNGCVGMVIETATDAVIAVAKVPFKVAGAVVDVVTPDGDDDSDD